MKDQSTFTDEVIHKDVVVIGNGPSGISLSMMLSGYSPYLTSTEHPDEMLSARLQSASMEKSLAQQPLEHLASGLEGRSTNPVSLLLDALEHPCADLGLEIESLVDWQYHREHEIDHVVIGKGPPGGSWHTMDPNILTLSLGSWMALPGYPYSLSESSDSQRRASAGSVAQYYEAYVKEMSLNKYFRNGLIVLSIEPIYKTTVDSRVVVCADNQVKVEVVHAFCRMKEEIENPKRKCSIITAINFIRSRTKCHKKNKDNCVSRSCKRPRDNFSKHDLSPNRKVREISDSDFNDFIHEQSVYNVNNIEKHLRITDDVLPSNSLTCNKYLSKSKTFNCDLKKNGGNHKIRSFSFSDEPNCNTTLIKNNERRNSITNISRIGSDSEMDVRCGCENDSNEKWLVHAYDSVRDENITYSCRDLVLANGASDLPNRLGLSAETYNMPWVLHDLRTLETQLDCFAMENSGRKDPVLVVGAGLSAADGVIATRFRSIPVLHVFRNKSVSLDKQLPENMYPEYHKVHQMMLDGGSTYPLYTALPEHEVTDISTSRIVTLTTKSGLKKQFKVSFVVILIGSRPDLRFLPSHFSLGINRTGAIDAKANPVSIDKMTHAVNCFDSLYALGPLAGDNFVRFIPGGALAIISDLYKKRNW